MNAWMYICMYVRRIVRTSLGVVLRRVLARFALAVGHSRPIASSPQPHNTCVLLCSHWCAKRRVPNNVHYSCLSWVADIIFFTASLLRNHPYTIPTVMNNLRRCSQSLLPSLQRLTSTRVATVLGRPAVLAAQSVMPMHRFPLMVPVTATTTSNTASYHTTRATSNPADKTPLGHLFTDEIIAEIEYHHERRDVTDLNLFLKHPATPRVMGWHPDLIFDGDTVVLREDVVPPMDDVVVVQLPNNKLVKRPQIGPPRQTSTMYSCLNRNKRFGTKANHGKRPCNSRGRKARKKRIGKLSRGRG